MKKGKRKVSGETRDSVVREHKADKMSSTSKLPLLEFWLRLPWENHGTWSTALVVNSTLFTCFLMQRPHLAIGSYTVTFGFSMILNTSKPRGCTGSKYQLRWVIQSVEERGGKPPLSKLPLGETSRSNQITEVVRLY